MQQQTTDPPYIPIRRTGWATRRSPRWLFAAGAVLLAIAVAVGLAHHPSQGERVADLRGLLQTLKTDVQSCSGGVAESLYVLHQVDSGASHDIGTALNVADTASANCSPANNEQLDDLTGVQVPESLASYHLQAAVTSLIDWTAPNAVNTAHAVATVLADRGKPSEAAARARLARALRKLDAQRAVVDTGFRPAIKALDPRLTPPVLHG